jgi:hypothetical protein
MFSQDGHLGNPSAGTFSMPNHPNSLSNGKPCSYVDVLTYDIKFSGIDGYDYGYQIENGEK